jgi:hypothetical protein
MVLRDLFSHELVAARQPLASGKLGQRSGRRGGTAPPSLKTIRRNGANHPDLPGREALALKE